MGKSEFLMNYSEAKYVFLMKHSEAREKSQLDSNWNPQLFDYESALQIRRSNKGNLGIISHISP